MGCGSSKSLPHADEDILVLSAQTHFTEKDVRALSELYKKLSSSIGDDKFISRVKLSFRMQEKFQLGLFNNSKKQSLLSDRMFYMFDSNNNGQIEFDKFVRSLNIFHPEASHAEKAMFAFQLYDIWKTGSIQREEVKLMILAFLDISNLTLNDDIVQAIIDRADANEDGVIDPEEWKDFTAKYPSILINMTIPYLRDLPTIFPKFKPTTEQEDETDEI